MAKKRASDEDDKAATGFSRASLGQKRKKEGSKAQEAAPGSEVVQNKATAPRRKGKPRSARPTAPMLVSMDFSDEDMLLEEDPEKEPTPPKEEEKPKGKAVQRQKSASSTPTPLKEEDRESLIQNGTTFVEPALRNDKIVTGQPMDEPPNIFAKRELSALTKKRGGKPRKSPSPNDEVIDEEALKRYTRKLANLNKIEKSTKLSTERKGGAKGVKGAKGAKDGKRAKNGARSITPPPVPKSKSTTSPVKKPKNNRRLADLSLKKPEKDSKEESEVSTETTPALVNQDYCSCCGLPGLFLCCETCPRSFHFHCLNPPMDPNELPDRWFCWVCIGEKLNKEAKNLNPNVGIFDKLLTNIAFENPKAFRLPREIVETFQGISMDKVGDYEDESFKEEKSYKELMKEMEDPMTGVLDRDGKPFICYKCEMGKSEESSELIKCDYCPLSWHLDCLNPPMASVKKLGSKWKCPNHADSVVKLRRKMHNQPLIKVESTATTEVPGDSHVDISNVEDRIHQFKDEENRLVYSIPNKLRMIENRMRVGNVTYELKEEDIILDFIKGAKIKRVDPPQMAVLQNLEPNVQTFVESLVKLSERPLVTEEARQRSMRDLLSVVSDETKAEEGVESLTDEEVRELLTIRRLMRRKGKSELLNFLKS